MSTASSASHVIRSSAAWLLAAVALAAWAQRGVLGSTFVADDFVYLYRMADAPFLDLMFVPNAGHLLVFRNLVFLATWSVWGSDPAGYYAIAWLTHLLNVALLVLLLRRLDTCPAIAGLAAALWGALAVHAGALGWYAVYGQVIALTLAFAVLHLALACRTPPSRAVRLVLAALMLALGASYGSALAVALALPFALPILRPELRAGRLPPMTATALVLIAAWVTTQLVYASQDIEQVSALVAPVDGPPPSLAARIATLYLQPRAVLMFIDLIGHGVLSLAAGPYGAAGASPLAARLAFAALLLGTVAGTRALNALQRRRLLAVALLAGAAYASIAVGRTTLLHSLLGPTLPLVPRYHYLPTALLAVLLVLLAQPILVTVRSAVLRRAAPLAAIAALLVAVSLAPIAYQPRQDVQRNLSQALATIRDAVQGAPAGEIVTIANRFVNLAQLAPAQDFPGLAAVFVIYYPDDRVLDRAVRFSESDPAVLAAAQRGRRMRTLLIEADPPRRRR